MRQATQNTRFSGGYETRKKLLGIDIRVDDLYLGSTATGLKGESSVSIILNNTTISVWFMFPRRVLAFTRSV
jgi:hypothetical protein